MRWEGGQFSRPDTPWHGTNVPIAEIAVLAYILLNICRPTMRQSQKTKIQQQLIHKTLAETWQRLQYLADKVPEGVNCDEDEEARMNVLNIWAIEEEWIIDPELRAEMSMIQTDEDGED